MSEGELYGLLGEIGGACTYDNMVKMFQEKMADDGVLMSEGELDGLLGDIEDACTYDNMVRMFREKMAGDGNDSDALIVPAFNQSRRSSGSQ